MPKVKMPPYLRRRKERLTDRQRDFAEANLGLLHHIAAKHWCKNLDFDDRLQEAYFGFAKAAKKFRANRGTKLSALANTCVHNDLYKADRSEATIRVPIYLQGERGDDHRLAAQSSKALAPISLQSMPVESKWAPTTETDDEAERGEVVSAVREALAGLKPRERDIVLNVSDDRYGVGRMASKHRLPKHKVRQIYYDACDKLRTKLAAFA